MNAIRYEQPTRIGLFGGTFNPIHCGHVRVAKDVLNSYRLSSIYLIPSALPPHKTTGTLAAASDRYEMACLALADESAIGVSDIEIQRSGRSYTFDTLRHFKALQAEDAELYFLIGLDAFLEIHTWKSFRQLFDLAAFIVMARPRRPHQGLRMEELALKHTKEWISDAYTLSQSDFGTALIHPDKKQIYLAQVTQVDISSSRIREMIRTRQSIHKWVGPSVAAYIDKKGLYR